MYLSAGSQKCGPSSHSCWVICARTVPSLLLAALVLCLVIFSVAPLAAGQRMFKVAARSGEALFCSFVSQVIKVQGCGVVYALPAIIVSYHS